jgi:quercetin dioxygenase-like cupin family protein
MIALGLVLFSVAALQASPPAQDAPTVQRSGVNPAVAGPAEYFTGRVRVENSFPARAPSRLEGSLVSFEPGARSNWHTHPLGQTLIVTAGLGWHQCEGGPIEEIRPGDVVQCPADQRHWHGASATIGMSHLSLLEALDGKVVEWMEPVTDAQYFAGTSSSNGEAAE